MKGFIKKRGEKGFTLVELLIVFTLLGVLAAIMIPSVSGLVGYGHQQSADTELSVVQTAMDSMMAKYSLNETTVIDETAATDNMSTFPVTGAQPDGEHPLYPEFLRNEITKGTYYCDNTGKVSQNATGYQN